MARRHTPAQLAAAFQQVLEEVLTAYVRHHVQRSGLPKLVLAGGVFANVKLNQRLAQIREVDEVFVFPAMADVGLCWGAGAFEATRNHPFDPEAVRSVYWGPEYTDNEIETALQRFDVTYRRLDDVPRAVGDLLARGHLVSRFGGRMEFGPRALGNRSILFHGRDKSVNDWLNRLLNRTEFMPFAPVTLAEHADDCYQDLDTGRKTAFFMTITFDCKQKMMSDCPAAVHIDGTARPQLIDEERNPTYYGILRRFFELTGSPSLINTSFNMHEEPIIRTPEEAVESVKQAGLDVLAIGPYMAFNRSDA